METIVSDGGTNALKTRKFIVRDYSCYNLRYADDTTLMAEIKEELKSLWMKVKESVKKLA